MKLIRSRLELVETSVPKSKAPCIEAATAQPTRQSSQWLNKIKLIGYIQMVLGLAERALNTKRCSGWDYAKKPGSNSCWDRPEAGHGETELNRLFYRLGWTKGWYKGDLRNKRFGELTVGETGCDFRPVKKKLLDLARKYDQTV